MSKLNNVKAVNQMIRGEHRTQTQKTKGYEARNIERLIGDSWTDKNGQQWIQKNGYKAKVISEGIFFPLLKAAWISCAR